MDSPWPAAMDGTAWPVPAALDRRAIDPDPTALDDIHAMLDLVVAAVAAARPGAGMHTTGILDGICGTARRARDRLESLRRPGEPHGASTDSPTDVNALLRGLRNQLAASLPPGADLRMRLAPGLWPVAVEPAEFEAAMRRLVALAAAALRDSNHGALCILTDNVIDYMASSQAAEFTRVSVVHDGDGCRDGGVRAGSDEWHTAELTLERVRRFAAKGEGWLEVRNLEGIGTAVHLHLRRAASEPDLPASPPGRHAPQRPPAHHTRACGSAT